MTEIIQAILYLFLASVIVLMIVLGAVDVVRRTGYYKRHKDDVDKR